MLAKIPYFAMWALIVVLSVLLAVITIALLQIWVFPSILIWLGGAWTTKEDFLLLEDLSTFAEVGSGFGIISALTTIVAVALLWKTYNLQKDELKKILDHSSEQIKHSREQIEHSRKQIEHSREQGIWNHVFQMCKFYKDMIEKSSYSGLVSLGNSGEAVENFKFMAEYTLRYLIWECIDRIDTILIGEGIQKKAEYFLADIEKAFSPYDGSFRMLYRIFKYIDELDDYDENKKQQVSRIPRSMLSNIELEAILINSLTSKGEYMRYYIRKYKILDNYKVEALSGEVEKHLRQRYDASVFKSQ